MAEKNLPPLDAWQYRLTRQPTQTSVAAGDLHLEVGADINRIEVTDAAGSRLGWLVGFPIDLRDACLVRTQLVMTDRAFGGPDAVVRALFDRLGGRFLFVATIGQSFRIYPDCSALVPCVFDPSERTVGSTAGAIMSEADYEARFMPERYAAFDIAQAGWFPAGLTCHRGLERLLPNHFLDLETWTVRRFWPTEQIEPADHPQETIAELIALVRAQIEILSRADRNVAISLTAGRDTRVLLSCARALIDQVDFVTIIGDGDQTCDSIMARELARDFRLRHIELPQVRATIEENDRYMRRGGHCVGDANAWLFPSVAPLRDDHVMVGGAGGEAGRGFYWRASDAPDTTISGRDLSARMGFWGQDELDQRLQDWIKGTGQTNSLINLDLAYIEHRMGAWGAAQFCSDPTLVRFAPFVTRASFELLLRLPEDWKRHDLLASKVVAQAWPDLAAYPFNSLGQWRDLQLKMSKARRNPKLFLRKMRQKLRL